MLKLSPLKHVLKDLFPALIGMAAGPSAKEVVEKSQNKAFCGVSKLKMFRRYRVIALRLASLTFKDNFRFL